MWKGSHKNHATLRGTKVYPRLRAGSLLIIDPALKHSGLALRPDGETPHPPPPRK